MKPAKGGITPKQSCSCTSCLYKSESDRPSLRKIITHGSKIDKLYYGKYIPLRERKLLDKLVRTRAVYDGIRNQLLSGSSISIGQANLKPRKSKPTMKPYKDTKKGGDVPALVDKGNVILPENISECCSCCVCSSTLNIQDEASKTHMHRDRRRWQMTSKSSVISRDRRGEKTTLGRAVHFKTKHIRSDPCTCTYKFSDIVKRHSKSVLKTLRKYRPEPVLEPLTGAPEQTKPKKNKKIRNSIHKLKQSKIHLVRGMQEGTRKSLTKIKETKTMIKENVEAVAKKSLEKMQDSVQKIQDKIETSKHKPENIIPKIEETLEEKYFKIRKDSLTKFREKLRKKRDLKDWECDIECHSGECVPEECFKLIKRRKLRKIKETNVRRESYSSEKRKKNIGDKPKVSEASIQAQKNHNSSEPSGHTTRKINAAKTQKLDSSCICVEIRKKVVKHTKQKRTSPGKSPTETMPKTSVPRKSSGLPKATPAELTSKEEAKIPKQSLNGVKVENITSSNRKEDKIKEAQMSQKARQAVRVGSSFSFNIEFYKDRPIVGITDMKTRQEVRSIIKERQQKLKSRDGQSFASKVHKRDKGSETTLNQSVKNNQANGLPLKRCFCTLKLKPRKTKTTLNASKSTNKKYVCPCTSPVIGKIETELVTEIIQTNKTPELSYVLEPNECKPICIPSECDPIECEKRIRKRNKKRHSVSIYTKKQMKSSASITSKSASSAFSRGLQDQHVRKPITHPHRESAATRSITPIVENSSCKRQVVRMGSTFSFQIEFSKGSGNAASPVVYERVLNKPPDINIEQIAAEILRREKSVPRAKRYIRHKYSQISSSTKSKFATQKYKLRRCFCTLKLNKTEKKRKVISTSNGTVTSDQSTPIVSEPKLIMKTVSIATKKVRKNKILVEPQLLPYECERGICTPGGCDPYECLELIKGREIKEMRTKVNTSNTDSRKTKSTSSFEPTSIIRSRTKKVQSTLAASKDKVPSSVLSEIKPRPRLQLESPKNINKHAVRISSSFSFNVEYYKNKPVKDVPFKVHQLPKRLAKQVIKPVNPRERGSQIANVTQRKSVLMQAVTKQKNVPIGPAMKRCFCTLNLRKPAKADKKDVITVGTKTPNFKSKQSKFSELVPYECEPYVCNPGECDPYECLKRIKKRNVRLQSREKGIIAKTSKMKSTSSSDQNVRLTIKDAYAQSKRYEEKIMAKKLKQENHTPKSDQTPIIQDTHAGKQPRQAVRLGSNFSFDIEFYKNRKSDNNQMQFPRERGDVRDSKLFKSQGEQPLTAVMRQHKSQVNVIKKVHRATGVVPILKRCFCTLQLQKKMNHPIKPPQQIYTVSRVGVTKPTFVHNQLLSENIDSVMTSFKNVGCYSTGYINRIAAIENSKISLYNGLSCSTVQFNTQLVFSTNRCHNKYAHSITVPICSQPTLCRFNSEYLNNDKKYVKPPKAPRSLCTKSPSPSRHIKKFSEISLLKYNDSYTSNIKQHPNEVSAYLRRQFCAMNIQVDKSSPVKQKLEPYECEPGVCIPYECDPLSCQERIMKRLMKKSSKSLGTQKRIHNASSTTLNTRHRSKRLQSTASIAPPRKIQSPSEIRQKTRYPGSQQQAVRVGSNFSFNIEFCKEKLRPPIVENGSPSIYRRYKTIDKKLKHRGTREYSKNRMNSESQSTPKMEHKGSSATPLLKRCFCTLKLNKKGDQEKKIRSTDDKGVAVDNDDATIEIIDSSQNTKHLKNRKLRNDLEPYECEPGFCVPGQCDPYDCFELIKKRGKDYGTNMKKLGKISTASMTPTQKKKMKNKCNQFTCKENRQLVQKYKHSAQSLDNTKPSRQAVRIGSSFNFNVEFFKENPTLQPRPKVTSKNMIQQPNTEIKNPRRIHDFKERFTEDYISMSHKDSQSHTMQHKKSTMTNSFMKRCFCTAKLLKKENTKSHSKEKTMNENVEQQSLGSQSFLQRCICVMKSLTTHKFKTGTPSQTEQQIAPKSFYGLPSHHLEPYECTPGVCVPGECDPYVCEQLIRKRNAKVCTKETCTGRPRTKSQSSRFQSYKTPRVKQTQMTGDTSSKRVKPSSSGDFYRKFIKHSGSPRRQAARIGSNFNFNIEFYKDRLSKEMFNDKSLWDHRRRRHRASDDSKRHKIKTRSRGSLERKKHRHSRDSQAQSINKQDRASGIGRLLERCFCTLNLRKPKVPRRYSETGTQSMRIAVSEPPNKDTRSVVTVNKFGQHKLEPSECEPNTCIPGQCDPYDCEKRIKRRLRREYGTSTVHFKTKSATNMVSSTGKLRNMKVQSRSKKTHRNRSGMERIRKSRYNKTNVPGTPSRQAVRIGSTFSFNIDVFKENGNDANIRCKPESKIRRKNVGDSHRNYRRRSSVSCNTKTCEAKTRMREVDSQVLAKKVQSTMSGVTPFLKRCFCTLKLQKTIARAQHENINKQTRSSVATDNKSTYTSRKLKKSHISGRTQHLDPYECEPGVCVPGQCDPYQCEKRIKLRDIKKHSVYSNTEKSQDYSKYVSTSAGHKGRKSHATSVPHESQKQKVIMADKPHPLVGYANVKPVNSPHHQAVRIGSNFSFDIEFYKDKCANVLPKETSPSKISYKSDRIDSVKRSSKSKPKNTGAGSRGISFYHHKSQAYGPKTETKGSGMGPLLKRCFCTLKLHKQGKQQNQPSVRLQADYTPQPSSFDASTGTKKQRRVVEPYECEPNVCVPGFCDPYECLHRIKQRQTKELGIATDNPSMRSKYSLTSKRNIRNQSLITTHIKNKRPQNNVSFDKEPSNIIKYYPVGNVDSNRQAVRIGSSFKFDIEFYKQSSRPNNQDHGDGQSHISASREQKKRTKKLKNRSSQAKYSPHSQEVQLESTQRQSRGSEVAPILKRCFCTLALQNTPKHPVVQKQTAPIEDKTKDMCTQSKCTLNGSKSLRYALDPYECEPNVCVPGECNPYDCYEIIKRRNALYKSKGTTTDATRYPQASTMTTEQVKFSQNKRTQSFLLGKHRRQHRSSSLNKSMIVEQPRTQLLSDIANRNVVKIGSNLSFNIEFYKEITPAAAEINYTNKHRDSGAAINTKQKYSYKTTRFHSRDSQAQTTRTQNKGSLVSNALKRCFCTVQLHKPNVCPPKSEKNTTCIDCKSIFRPQKYQVYYQKTSLKNNRTQRCLCTTCDDKMCQNTKATSTKSSRRIKLKRRSTWKSKKLHNANEMETILPYAPNKFNKKASKTLFAKTDNKGIVAEGRDYCMEQKFPKLKKSTISKNRRLKKSKSTKKLKVNKIKKVEPKGKDAITSTNNNLNNKSFICRCKDFFSIKKNIKNNATETCAEICSLCKSNKTKKAPDLKKVENLKKTKSERSPAKTFIKGPKKLKSLETKNNRDLEETKGVENLKKTKSERRPTKTSNKEPKKSKSLKIKNNPYLEEARQDYSEYQSGDTKKKKEKRLGSNKQKGKTLSDGYKTDHLRCGDDYLYLYVSDLNQKLIKDNKKQVKFSDPYNETITASANLMPKSVRKNKLASKKKVSKKRPPKLEPMKANCQTDSAPYLDIVLQPSYCSGTQLEGLAAISFKGDSKSTKRETTMEEHPLQNEINRCAAGTSKKKTIDKRDESKAIQPSLHAGASLRIAAKGSKKQYAPGGKGDIEQIIETLTKNINAIKNTKSRLLNKLITKEQICSCYSSVCECAKAIRKEKEKALKIEMELEMEKRMLKEKERRRKEAVKEATKKQKEFWKRQKRYEREDAMRRHKRTKDNKLLAHRLKHVKTSDVLLAADSILDIAKLGCNVVGGVARSTGRFLQDPRYTCQKMKNAASDPGSMIKNVVDESGLVATLKRVFMRITAMRGMKAMKSNLEKNEFTGYLMKMAEDDPRKRMKLKKKKQAKKKQPALDDFECSLYMASLRRKRFLAVYYLCPWFYPHFITLLNVVEQVTDLILYLLAVFVWSPCILCMELCRAFMCCFFCTG